MSFPPIACPVDLLPWQGYFNGVVFGAGTQYPLLEISQGFDMVAINSQDSQYPRGQGDFIGLDVSKGRDIDLDFWVAPRNKPSPSAPPIIASVAPQGAQGNTPYNYQLTYISPHGETLPSATVGTVSGNASLDSSSYNLISWAAVPLPAGSSGNLVYDSNLTNAIASVGATWPLIGGGSVGTGPGQINVLNAGTNSAELVVYGNGGSGPYPGVESQPIQFIPGKTYTLSAIMDGTNVTSGSFKLEVQQGYAGAIYAALKSVAGSKQLVSDTFVMPTGVDSCPLTFDISDAVTASGAACSVSQIQLTQTSAVQPYEPGPLWTYELYRQTAGQFYALGYTTALAFEDTGQTVAAKTPPAPPVPVQKLLFALSNAFQVQGNLELPMWIHLPGWGPLGFMVRTRKRSFPIDLNYSAASLAKPKVKVYATDPVAYGPLQTTTIQFTASSSGAGVTFPISFPVTFSSQTTGATLTNNGNFRVYPVVTFTGPLVSPTLALNGQLFTLTNPNQGAGNTVNAGETVTVDFRTHSVLLNVTGTPEQSAVNNWVPYGSTFFDLPPGENTITLSASTISSGSVQVKWADGYYL